VSRVLNSHRSVSPEVRERVVEAIRALGYEPDAVAQSMRLRTTRTVACAIRDISIAGFGSFVKAAEDVLRQAGYTLLLTNTDEEPLREIELLRTFAKRRVDGVIMTVSDEADEPLLRTLQEMRVPIVLMDRDIALPLDVVAIDHRGGARAATAHLLGRLHEAAEARDRDVADGAGDRARGAQAHALRDGVRLVAERADGLDDPLAHLRADRAVAVEHARHGADRDPGRAGDVADRQGTGPLPAQCLPPVADPTRAPAAAATARSPGRR